VETFLEVGRALPALRDEKFYRENYKKFAVNCNARWKIARAHACRVIDAVEVMEGLVQALGGEYPMPRNEALIKEITRERFDDATGTGALTTPGGSQPKARAYYVAKYPDAVGREQAMANYGTNGGSALSRAATVPVRSDTILVTSNEFNDRGELELVTDPEAVETEYTHDDAGRMTQQVEDNGAGKLNKTTNFEYNGDGRLIKLTAVNATTGNQETEWIYGTTLSDSDLASNDLLRAKEFPDGSSSDRVEYQYNRQGEVKQIEDQRGSIRALDYDDLGRLTQDRVTTLGTNVDSTIRRIARTYEVRGMLEKVTSYNNATVGSGTVINEVKLEYNDFGQLEKDW
jgi:YD repeat-containing protein